MGNDVAARRWISLLAIGGLTALAGWSAGRAVLHAMQPSGYHAHLHPADPYVYPTREIAAWVAAIAVELAVAAWLIARAQRPAFTTGLLAAAFALLCFPSAVLVLHAPLHVGDHLCFVALSAAWLFAVTVLSWLAQIAGFIRARRVA